MRTKIGIFAMILGTALVLGALSLFLYNRQEAAQAEQASSERLTQVIEEIEVKREEIETSPTVPAYVALPLELLEPVDLEMPEVEIDGYNYVGYVSIEKLGLELPVMSDWSYPQLKIAPCRYVGSTRSDDLVIMAHNYTRHFGRLSELTIGDSVVFIDMDGVVNRYEVAAMDILPPTAVEEMTAGDFDLTLFTCTYGGRTRVTVFCDRISE